MRAYQQGWMLVRYRSGMRRPGVEALPSGDARRTGGPWSTRGRVVQGAWPGYVYVLEGASLRDRTQLRAVTYGYRQFLHSVFNVLTV